MRFATALGLLVLGALVVLCACSTPNRGTWIGKNVAVVVDSESGSTNSR